jgi:hypothetical protein
LKDYDERGSSPDSDGPDGRKRAADRIDENKADEDWSHRDPDWAPAGDPEWEPAGAPQGGAVAGGAVAPAAVLPVNTAATVPALLMNRPVHVLPSSEFLKNTAKYMMKKRREYFLVVFLTLDKLVVDLDVLEDKQLDIMQKIMMLYTQLGRDPMEHLQMGEELSSAMEAEFPFEDDLEDICEKQEAVVHMVKKTKPEFVHFLQKFSKLRLQTIALAQRGSANDDIAETVALIGIIDKELQAMYTRYPRVRDLFWKLYLAAQYRATILGGFQHMYASYVKLEIRSLRRQTEAGGCNDRLLKISQGGRAANTPSLSGDELHRINEEETTGDAGTGPTDKEAGRAEHDSPWQVSHSDGDLNKVWSAGTRTMINFDPTHEKAIRDWAEDNKAALLQELGYPKASDLGPDAVKEIMKHLNIDRVSDVMEKLWSENNAQEELEWQGSATEVAEAKASAIVERDLVLDGRIAERVAYKKEASKRAKATRAQRAKEGLESRKKYADLERHSEVRESKRVRDCKQGRVAQPAPPNHVGEGSSSGYGRADAIAAPRTQRAPAPARTPLPDVQAKRQANYIPVQIEIGNTDFVWPSDRRISNPNLILEADYYEAWIAKKEEALSQERSHQACKPTDKGQRRIERWEAELHKIEFQVEHNAKKLSGAIGYSLEHEDDTRTDRALDELNKAAHASFTAQRAAAAAAQEAQEIIWLQNA